MGQSEPGSQGGEGRDEPGAGGLSIKERRQTLRLRAAHNILPAPLDCQPVDDGGFQFSMVPLLSCRRRL